MSLEAQLTAALQAVCPQVYPDQAPAEAQLPYVIYEQVGGPALVYTEGTLPPERAALMQITAWHSTRLGASQLMLNIEAALCAAIGFTATPQAALQSAPSDDPATRGAMQDFEIWADR